jgi:hypothetical protein
MLLQNCKGVNLGAPGVWQVCDPLRFIFRPQGGAATETLAYASSGAAVGQVARHKAPETAVKALLGAPSQKAITPIAAVVAKAEVSDARSTSNG